MTVVGLYADGAANLDSTIGLVEGMQLLQSLDPASVHRLDCVLVDVRTNAETTLKKAAALNGLVPIIALVERDCPFPAGYPFGCYLHDHTTVIELGSSLFWHRVNDTIATYTAPLRDNALVHPIYSLFQEIVNHSSDWIFVKDLEHRFLLASDNFATLAGLPLDQIIGKNDLQIGNSPEHVYGDSKTKFPGFWPQDDAVTQSGKISIEENPHWDLYSRSERFRRTIRVPLKDHKGIVYALLVCSQDITDQRKKESLLEDRTKMLDRVTREKQSAEQSRQIAEEAVEAKAKFLAAASHDLRQPLHAMGLFLDILNTCIKGDKEQHLVQQIKRSCAALNGLFNGCLDISRLDAGVIDRVDENFYASSFIENLSDEFREQANEKQLDYRFKVDESIMLTDSMLLARVVRNLVNNAINNTETGQVLISCTKGENKIQLSVIDTGIGIPELEQKRIFHEFHQVDSRQQRHGNGLGLGLAIVKRLCELLEIELSLISESGKGSSFSLSIPSGDQSRIIEEKSTANPPSLEGARVLIIDDDPSIRQGMEVLLQAYCCETVSSADVHGAMDALSAKNMVPNVIVADYHLGGGVCGARAVDEIRDALGIQIPAVMITGDTSEESERDAIKHSLLILHKPVSSEVLLSTIAYELSQSTSFVH